MSMLPQESPEWEAVWRSATNLVTRRHPLQVDACILGATQAGLTAAWLLAREGCQVAVVELEGRSRSALSFQPVSSLPSLRRACALSPGPAGQLHKAALATLSRMVAKERLNCCLERLPGYLYSVTGRGLELQHEAARQAGLPVIWWPRVPRLPFQSGRCLRFPNQLQVNQAQFLAGLSQAVERMAGKLFGDTCLDRLESAGGRHRITVWSGWQIESPWLLVCTPEAPAQLQGSRPLRAAPRRCALAFERPEPLFDAAVVWDLDHPCHQFSQGPGTLIVAGEGVEYGLELGWQRLEGWTRERFPQAGAVLRRGSQELVDSLADLSSPPGSRNFYVVNHGCGDLVQGTVAGLALADLVLGKTSGWHNHILH